jgi:hypothetical protein
MFKTSWAALKALPHDRTNFRLNGSVFPVGSPPCICLNVRWLSGDIMKNLNLIRAGVFVLLATTFLPAFVARAQDTQDSTADDSAIEENAASIEVSDPDDDVLSEDDLDLLVAPVALYPDSLLTQVLVASTYPLDVMKADRFISDNEEMPPADRADAVQEEDWDPSVQSLAGGFPTVINLLASDIDQTQQLGDAMLAQTDDILDAVQRQRARAIAVGSLQSNEAQTVEVEEEAISIAPADPEIIYVPTYDSTAAYSTRSAAETVGTTTETVYTTDAGYSAGNMLATGAIAFGSALLLNEIFDDDDDYYYDRYYGRGSSHMDWDDGNIYPDRKVNVEGHVNIYNEKNKNSKNNNKNKNKDKNKDKDKNNNKGKNKSENNNGKEKDKNKNTKDNDKAGKGQGAKDRVGDRDPNSGGKNDGAWKPPTDKKDKARDDIAKRENKKKNKKNNAKDNKAIPSTGGGASQSGNKGGKKKPASSRDKLKAGQKGGSGGDESGARAKLNKASTDRKSQPGNKAKTRDSALKPKSKGSAKTKDASRRGKASVSKGKTKAKPAAKKPAAKAKPKAKSRPKAVSKPKKAKAPARKPSKKSSSFKKRSGGGSKARSSSSRGKKSSGKRKSSSKRKKR